MLQGNTADMSGICAIQSMYATAPPSVLVGYLFDLANR